MSNLGLENVLVIFAHHEFEGSRINRAFYNAVKDLPNLIWHDLYEVYPHQMIDVAREQKLLTAADVVILQHPFYWYSCPALMKHWLDSVLTLGWAYGKDAHALRDKAFIQVISSGSASTSYQRENYNNFSMAELLRPFEQTADLCEMHYHQPFLTQGSMQFDNESIAVQAKKYRDWMQAILQGKLPPIVNTHQTNQADFVFHK